jgi:hypothetical protein
MRNLSPTCTGGADFYEVFIVPFMQISCFPPQEVTRSLPAGPGRQVTDLPVVPRNLGVKPRTGVIFAQHVPEIDRNRPVDGRIFVAAVNRKVIERLR